VELDPRVGDYAAAIVRDADLLLATAVNLNDQQQAMVEAIKKSTIRFLSLYHELLPHITALTVEARLIAFDLRAPLSSIAGYCELLLVLESDNLTPAQTELLHQIKTAHDFIFNTFTEWVNNRPSI
jgi:signal transduction histidine kinase